MIHELPPGATTGTGTATGTRPLARREVDQAETAVVLYAEFTARAGAAEAVEQLLNGFAATVRAEPGNVVFDVYRRAEAPERFFIFEIYRGQAAFQAHLGADSGREFNQALRPLIVEDASELSFLSPVGF